MTTDPDMQAAVVAALLDGDDAAFEALAAKVHAGFRNACSLYGATDAPTGGYEDELLVQYPTLWRPDGRVGHSVAGPALASP